MGDEQQFDEWYPEAKVYFDGSHYIAIPHTERPYKPKRKVAEEYIDVNINSPPLDKSTTAQSSECSDIKVQNNSVQAETADTLIDVKNNSSLTGADVGQCEKQLRNLATATRCTKKQIFEKYYKDSLSVKKSERRKYIVSSMLAYFKDENEAVIFVDKNLERKQRNLICRRIRMTRKANLANFNYFCTFTYDSKKHTEESFKKKLKNKLSLLAYRQGWRYMGVWERSPEKQRLHFHGLFNIPEGKMIGEVERHDDYSVRLKWVQTTYQNTYFNERFGRSDFEAIDDKSKLGEAMAYLMKYIEKTNERIVYSKGMPQYFISDVMQEDILCPFGIEDGKLLLYDDFRLWDEGVLMGEVNEATIRQMRKSN